MEGLELLGGQRLQIVILGDLAGALQPTQADLRCTRVRDCALTQTALNVSVARRFAVTTRGAGPRLGSRSQPLAAGVRSREARETAASRS
jgi:hypothetical protein